MTAEDKIHLALLLALAAAGAVVFGVREPRAVAPEATPALATAVPLAPPGPEIARAELDAAIAPLRDWVERRHAQAETPRELGLAIAGLGRAALGADLERTLATLTRAWPLPEGTPSQRPDTPRPSPTLVRGEEEPLAVLGSLLEAGVSLDQRVQLRDGSATLRELVSSTLDKARKTTVAHAETDAWTLDLAAFATLAGMRENADMLGRLTYDGLRRMELAYREWNVGQGAGELDGTLLVKLGASFRERGEFEPSAAHLHASSALFRAVAVLNARDLEEPARRHLRALSFRYQLDRTLYRQLLDGAETAGDRDRVHLAALERLGRLEQALYQAHLASRREDRTEPAPQLAKLMREAGRDILDHWASLRQSVFAEPAPASSVLEREAALRAAVHALRGLRTARIATRA